jgi:hypothetical protein
MRFPLIIAAALALWGGTAAVGTALAAEQPLTGREAAIAVREEVGNNWALLETVPRRPESRETTVSVDCAGASSRRRLCAWEASNSARGQIAQGLAVVVGRTGGAEARLYAFRCEGRAGLGCL